jgi:hypothetical protein
MGIQYDMAGGMAFGDPTMQQQHDGRISYDASDAQMMQQMYPHQFNQHSMPSALLGRKHAPDRRPLRFWQPFNDWWRSELNRLGRRPTSEEIGEWYAPQLAQAAAALHVCMAGPVWASVGVRQQANANSSCCPSICAFCCCPVCWTPVYEFEHTPCLTVVLLC